MHWCTANERSVVERVVRSSYEHETWYEGVCMLEQATWTFLKHVRTERDQYAQLLMGARTLQMRFRRNKKELQAAQEQCLKLMPYYQL